MTTGITREEASNIALAAAKEATRQTLNESFALFGVNLMNFNDVKAFREDLEFVRSMRSGATTIGAKFVLTAVTILAGAVAISSWEYIKMVFHIH